MNIIGKTTIQPILFYTGKLSGYSTWIILLIVYLKPEFLRTNEFFNTKQIALPLLYAGLLITVLSMINLGKSTRLGLPDESTTFKTKGLYKLSRNPMYVGFNLITLASMIYSLNWLVVVLGIYSMVIYHFIILGEERFMEQRFDNDYLVYKQKVRRYF